jgi:glucose-1-phosphate thymidylyltransferase
MQGVVPAAGKGTRMQPLTESRPKGLVDVAGQPLLTHVFEALTNLGVTELIVIVGYRGGQIREYYGTTFEHTPITYVTQQSRDGLADALVQASPQIDGEFVLLNGDNVIQANTASVVSRHRESDADVTALIEQMPSVKAQKGAVFELEDGRITGLVEKPADPPSMLVPRGFYAFSPKIIPACGLVTPNDTGEYELTDAIDLLLAAGRSLETIQLKGWCYNVNTPDDRKTVETKLRSC